MLDYLVSFGEGLAEALGEDLVSVVVFGGAVREDAGLPSVMVVAREVDTALLDRMEPHLARARQSGPLAVMTLTEAELGRSTDVFPIKFLGLKRFHRVLHGRDVVRDLKVETTHLRLRCEQELKNLSLRLRQQYLQRSHFPGTLAETLINARTAFFDNLAVLAELKNGKAQSLGEATAAANEWGLDTTAAADAGKLSLTNPPDLEEARALYGRFMAMLDQAAALADEL